MQQTSVQLCHHHLTDEQARFGASTSALKALKDWSPAKIPDRVIERGVSKCKSQRQWESTYWNSVWDLKGNQAWDGPAVLAVVSFSMALDAAVSARTCSDDKQSEATKNGTGATGAVPAAGNGVRCNSSISPFASSVFQGNACENCEKGEFDWSSMLFGGTKRSPRFCAKELH